MGWRGKEYVARLAALEDAAPLVVQLPGRENALGCCNAVQLDARSPSDAIASQRKRALQVQVLRVVVKIRPRQLHYLVNGRLACMVRSHSAITAVGALTPPSAPLSDEAPSTMGAFQPQLLVAVADGSLWCVTLPSSSALSSCGGIACQLWLQHSPMAQHMPSTSAPSASFPSLSQGITPTQFAGMPASQADSIQVKLLHQVPGAVGVENVPLLTGTAAVVRSVIAPTTVILTGLAGPASLLNDKGAMEIGPHVELDELEGEQSTCTWSVHGSDKNYAGLLARLFAEPADRVNDTLFVLQGDSDGYVRFVKLSVRNGTQHPATLQVSDSGTLVESIGEPVAAILPFSTAAEKAAAHDEWPPLSDALLVCGVHGRLAIWSATPSESNVGQQVQTRGVQRLQLCQGSAILSIAIVRRLAALVYCSQGSAFVCSCTDLAASTREDDGAGSADVPLVDRIARKLPFPAGVARLAVEPSEESVAILFASGRVVSMDITAFSAVVARVLPLRLDHLSREQPLEAADADQTSVERLPRRSLAALQTSDDCTSSDEGCVRHLLAQISRISEQAAVERTHSLALDSQLEALHSVLRVQQVIHTQGVTSVISCSVCASQTVCGSFAERTTVALTCSVRFGSHSSAIQSFDNWFMRVHVHPHHQEADMTAYTFPLQDPTTSAIGGDTTLILDPDTMHLEESTALVVTCELVFRPPTSSLPDRQGGLHDEAALALATPVGSPRQLLLIQLGQPTNVHTSASTAASSGRRGVESSRYASRYATSDEKSSGHSTVPWWSALASHAEDDEAFAETWSKVIRMAAEQRQDGTTTSMTKLTSPSRFSVTIPSALPVDVKDRGESARIDHMLGFLGQLLPTVEAPVLRRNCRVVQGGKLWLTLLTLGGNLLLLKLQPQGTAGALSLTMQCSDGGELSAMRALVLETTTKLETQRRHDPHEVNRACSRLSSVLGAHLGSILSLEALVQELMAKVASSLGSSDASFVCTDEVVHAFAQLASIEAQVLDIYWKTRRSLDKTNV